MLTATQSTKDWITNFVIHHNLCPFAARPMLRDTVRFVECEETDFDALIRHFLQESLYLTEVPAAKVMTTLLIYPKALEEFEEFLDFKVAVEEISEEAGLHAMIQLAHFHPDYQFAEVPADDPANATNRSPFPVLQLLRVDEMSKAIDAYPDVENIPERNIELLRKLARK
ncbi:hypothetical protein CEQ90_19525 [Lewinellaceae bacterium SD302]|nr:hypothetical protein CEQ90_19525 [Lewinellaceae bacterium SD302]